MASKKALTRRLFNFSNRILCNNSAVFRTNTTTDIALDPAGHRIFRRFLHQRANFPPPSTFTRSLVPPLPIGLVNVMEQLAAAGVVPRDRIQFDGLAPPAPADPEKMEGLTVEETRKVVRLTELVRLKRRLKEIQRSWITYQEFVRICEEDCVDGDEDYGVQLANRLDHSGAVIVLGNFVLLDPEQMAKKIACLIPTPGMNMNNNDDEDSRTSKELEAMEKQKAIIDCEANHQVRRELWLGLGFLVAQTAAIMRLTFWELSWDVMEPICFFITSSYFMGGYAFFLSTSKEPCFEGLYHSRFMVKQKQLMKLHNFDVHRYHRLKRYYSNDLRSSNHQFN